MGIWDRFFKAHRGGNGSYTPPAEPLVANLDPAAVQRVRLIFEGRVQGVGFRFNQMQMAPQHNITGWVRNLDNGDVEAEWQGTGADIRAMVDALHVYYRKFRYNFRVTQCDPLPLVEGETELEGKY